MRKPSESFKRLPSAGLMPASVAAYERLVAGSVDAAKRLEEARLAMLEDLREDWSEAEIKRAFDFCPVAADFKDPVWVVGCAGTEEVMHYQGKNYLYIWNSVDGRHGYYVFEDDLILADDKAPWMRGGGA